MSSFFMRVLRQFSLVAASSLAGISPSLAALAIDANVSRDSSASASNITTPAFNTAAGNELLLAFVSADARTAGVTVSSVTTTGLTWQLVRRANAQLGTAEIWRAVATTPLAGVTVRANLSQTVAASITVISFSGADVVTPIGGSVAASAASGAPTASLTTTRDGSWVFGVGTDWDNPVSRTVGANQAMVHQYLATVGDTYWVQRQNVPTPSSGTQVFINDTAPTADRYNLSIVEVLPAGGGGGGTFPLNGAVTPAANGAGSTITVTQGANTIASATADGSGSYSITGLANGTYTVTPTKSGFTFSPASASVTVNGGGVVANFAIVAPLTRAISGSVTPAAVGSGTTVTLSGDASASTTANSAGSYSFTGLQNGSYTVTPSKAGTSFTPANRAITINGSDVTGANFAVVTYGATGSISPASLGSGSSVTLSGPVSATVSANSSGSFSFTGLVNGSYSIAPNKAGVNFVPASLQFTINGASQTGLAFTASTNVANYPDLSVMVPPGQISVSGTGASKIFLYTHDTFNGGSGPLQIQPVYNEASGNYQGYQDVLRLVGNQWSVAHTTPVAAAFVFHPVHGHFHFPFASFGLFARNPDGSIGAVVAMSPKVGFCIDNSFIYDPTLPNAGYGDWGSCTDPTSLRGLSIGAVDEYDFRDDGQSIPIPNLPDGTYWLRAIADPEGLLEESNETNNETDLEVTITGNTVNVLRTVVPVLPAAPVISVTSPTNLQQVNGSVQLAAETPSSGVSGVRYLLDGLPIVPTITSPPYVLTLNTVSLQNGEHWLAAQALTPAGIDGTSPVIFFTVNNSSNTPPSVTISEPEPNEVVSAIVNVGAVAVAQVGTPSVQFFADGQPIGAPDTTPPFMVQWNTTNLPDGPHVLTASATDQLNNVVSSDAVPVTVDNTHPASVISIDTTVFRDTSDTMTTPAFATTTPSDLLVAFVAYDGPSGAPQTATVSGAGLTWTLVKRSNAQSGTSEIWSARASSVLTNVTVTSQPSRTGAHGSLTVVAYKNASGAGVAGQASAPSGAPDIYIPGVQPGNWVFAVGNDWDRAVARTPVSGQVLVHQRVDTAVGDTFWVQSTTAPSTTTGLVTIHDNAPTNDQWNYAAVEIVATRQ
jgi:Bacterial Ig domain/Lysyl oxidase